jgi:hypothetical protein
MTRPMFEGSPEEMAEARRGAALQLAIEAFKDDPQFRPTTGEGTRTGRIVAAAARFETFLRDGGQPRD